MSSAQQPIGPSQHHLTLDPSFNLPPTRSLPAGYHNHGDHTHHHGPEDKAESGLPPARHTHYHPSKASSTAAPSAAPSSVSSPEHKDKSSDENASLTFVGNATTILEWEGVRLMTDPNFLHAGDHVHLGPGVTAKRVMDPGVGLGELPRVDAVLLSHYHEDHFDRVVEDSLRRDLPIISTPHAKDHLANKGDDSFTSVFDLDTFQHMTVDIKQPSGSSPSSTSSKVPAFRVTAMPGKHVPPGILNTVNDLLGAVPPTNGWMLELGYRASAAPDSPFQSGYRIYISGDTLFVDELKEIPQRYAGQNIDLMLIHLGGTTIPGPNLPLLMVTMDAKQGVELMRLIQPDVTIPIHFDDYDVFLSNLDEFKKAVEEAGMTKKTVYLDRLDQYKFAVKG